jgi:cardiolipin synthase A/B
VEGAACRRRGRVGLHRFSLSAPLEAFLRDHRKTLVVDGEYGSVGGVCIADQWVEVSPETGLYYRDTTVGFKRPAMADLEQAFDGVWDRSGKEPLRAEERPEVGQIEPACPPERPQPSKLPS